MSGFIIKYRLESIQLGMVVFIALVARWAAIPFVTPMDPILDNATYQTAVSDIMTKGVISNDYIMPLYPLLLALFGGGTGAQLWVGMLSGVSSVVLVWVLARCLFSDARAGLVAGFIMAIYPMAIFYSVLGLTESVFVVLLLGAYLSLYKNKTTLASALFVLSILTRPVIDLFAPIAIVFHTLVVRKAGIKQAIRNLAVYGMLYALMMAPWWYHNYTKHGQLVRLNLGFGLTLYAGNNPVNSSGGAIGIQDYDLTSFAHFTNHIERDRALREAAVSYIRQDPAKFFKMAFVKFTRFWRLLPFTPLVKGNSSATTATMAMLPLILLTFITLITRREMFLRLVPLLGFIVYLTLVHMVIVGSVRYRFPLEPLLIVLAAPSLVLAWDHVFGK